MIGWGCGDTRRAAVQRALARLTMTTSHKPRASLTSRPTPTPHITRSLRLPATTAGDHTLFATALTFGNEAFSVAALAKDAGFIANLLKMLDHRVDGLAAVRLVSDAAAWLW
jgi:hypothetical protein